MIDTAGITIYADGLDLRDEDDRALLRERVDTSYKAARADVKREAREAANRYIAQAVIAKSIEAPRRDFGPGYAKEKADSEWREADDAFDVADDQGRGRAA